MIFDHLALWTSGKIRNLKQFFIRTIFLEILENVSFTSVEALGPVKESLGQVEVDV